MVNIRQRRKPQNMGMNHWQVQFASLGIVVEVQVFVVEVVEPVVEVPLLVVEVRLPVAVVQLFVGEVQILAVCWYRRLLRWLVQRMLCQCRLNRLRRMTIILEVPELERWT